MEWSSPLSRHHWSSGRIHRFHRWGPCSIHGWCNISFFFDPFLPLTGRFPKVVFPICFGCPVCFCKLGFFAWLATYFNGSDILPIPFIMLWTDTDVLQATTLLRGLTDRTLVQQENYYYWFIYNFSEGYPVNSWPCISAGSAARTSLPSSSHWHQSPCTKNLQPRCESVWN